jgi:pyruvate dehydrogenase E2 component (dihydrolipoamide acetyltransferase)
VPDFRLPDLGEGLEEAEVVTWLVAVGDRVEVDQNVVEVETAKAAVEVPIPFAGVVSAVHAQPGEKVAVGAPLITVAAADEPAGFREPGVTVAGSGRATAGTEGSGNVLIGYGTGAPTSVRRRGRRRPVAAPVATCSGPVPVISPLVRKLARDAGLDLHSVRGTGPAGVLRRTDVEAALGATATDAAPTRSSPAAGERRVPLQGVRRVAAEKLSRSRREIPEATVWVDVDATEFLAARRAINAAAADCAPVSVLALFARLAVLGLRRYPELNARIDGDEIVIPEHVHLGFAAQTDRGLVVPVVRDAHRLTTRELAAALTDKTDAARSGTLAPADLTGGTFTVNNYGVFGVDGSAAIINHPEVAILGLGRIIDRPWVVHGELTVRKITQLTLAFDHRVCDGGTAGGFLRRIADWIESPIAVVGDF